MAASSLLALIDDIATVLDDIAVMSKLAARKAAGAMDEVAALTKVASRKTAGVLGDDLALNAQQVTGVRAERELPVVWAVARGSLVNKAILVPAALAISAFAPWAVTLLLMVGGAFLCYEGFEKVAHRFLHTEAEDAAHDAELASALIDPAADLVALEKEKIKGAIRTDFILSAEIIAITLGTVSSAPFAVQVVVLVGIALVITAGVYGLVAGIVKLDDVGVLLSRTVGDGYWARVRRAVGDAILWVAPHLMKGLSIVGTVAMFLVGGGILAHGVPWLHDLGQALGQTVQGVPSIGGVLATLAPLLFDAVVGLVAGALLVGALSLGRRMWRAATPPVSESGAVGKPLGTGSSDTPRA